jgi:MFS-type transporter involved in bile tolerance (Atg22 family)
VLVLAVITNVGYGTIFYSFSILLGEGAAADEFGRTLLSSALGLGVVVSGVLAPIVGTLCDITGSRWVFFAGAVLGSAGLAAFSRTTEGWQVIAAWALLIGPAMACTFYEPAYVTIDQWFAGRSTGTAIGVLTLVGGLSATIFIPLTQSL